MGRLGEALPGVSTGDDLGAHGARGSRGPGTSTRMSAPGLCSFFFPASCGGGFTSSLLLPYEPQDK